MQIELRSATPDDALVVAQVHVRSWQKGYENLLPSEFLASLRVEERAQRYLFGDSRPEVPQTIVALAKGAVRGFATTRPLNVDTHASATAELCALYVDPDYWETGIGSALESECRRRLTHQGFNAAKLWLLDGNVRGARFYEDRGWIMDGERKTDTIWGIRVDQIGYRCRLDVE